jgi:hypothetical protein
MKINRTEKEWEKDLIEEYEKAWLNDNGNASLGEAIVRAVKRASIKVFDLEFDPEEPELRFCPNPECVSPGALRVQWSNVSGRVVCDGCSLEGPAGARCDAGKEDAEAEAVRLWNLLPRTQDEVPAKRPGGPELPKRIKVSATAWLQTADSDAAEDQVPLGILAREATARYNFVSVLLEYYDLHKGMETSEGRLLRNFAGLLRQEREKLR